MSAELPGFTSADKLPLAAAPAVKEGEISVWQPPAEWSRAWQDLVLDTVDPQHKLTDLEVAYFFARAKKLGLDPLARQIFPLALRGKMEPFVGIHGIRMLAERTGERGSEKVTARTYAEKSTALESVEVTVTRIRGGFSSEYPFSARMSEFAAKEPEKFLKTPDGKDILNEAWVRWSNGSWATKPEVMLTKCAAANAYRMAFPEVLGGLYIPEEVER